MNIVNDTNRRECEEKLREAAATGDMDTLKQLINKGVDINSQNIINHWTALHWGCKRGHSSIVSYLLKNGADPALETINRETCWQLAPHASFSTPFTGKAEITNSCNNNNTMIPNYLAHPVFPYGKQDEFNNNNFRDASYVESSKGSTPISEEYVSRSFVCSTRELVLKVKLEEENDFIEIDFPDRDLLTFTKLLEEICKQLSIPIVSVQKIRKLPNTIVRNDRDVKRFSDFQELEVIIL